MKIPFLGGAYEGRSSNVSPSTCINLFYEKGADGESLVGTAGATVHATITGLANGEVRGGIAYNDLAKKYNVVVTEVKPFRVMDKVPQSKNWG